MAQSLTQPQPNRHIPSLDGIRGISIILVILGHLAGTKNFPLSSLGIGDHAHLGVVVFFVISGYLITHLLSSEHLNFGRISLKRFYARRCLRLFPACYVYVGVLFLIGLMGWIEIRSRDLGFALAYLVNYLPDRSWQVGHLWSLSIEEQFYLLWPGVFVLAGPIRSVWVAMAVIALAPVARGLERLFLHNTIYSQMNLFPMVADSLATGCLLAMIQSRLELQKSYLLLFKPLPSMIMLTVVLLLNRYMGYTVISVFGSSILHFLVAILIHRSVYSPADLAGKMLNWRPLAVLGTLSYSLYLWQQIFLNRNDGRWMTAFPQNLGFAVIACLASYFLLEKPLLRLRSRLRA